MILTVKEKEHWKNRITQKLDQAIDSVQATAKPNFMEEIQRQSRVKAVESMGLAELEHELDRIKVEEQKLFDKRLLTQRRMLAVVRGVPVEHVDDSVNAHSKHYELKSAIRRRQELIEKEVMAQSELGRRILRLQHEKEELLDTVWLATSPKQIRELWATVSDLLNQESTGRQEKALHFEPIQTGSE